MIEILFENPWFLVINKPSGVLTQAVAGIDSIQSLLINQLQDPRSGSPTPFIGIPHRLDRATSGALVVARNQRALRRLSDQFASRKVRKIYHAIVPRMASSESITWRDTIRKVPDEARAELASETDDGAKEAVLHFRPLAPCWIHGEPTASLVEIELETGRMHQIRLQFASHGFPILGDSLYGSEVEWQDCRSGQRESPIALHARSIEFRNPQNAEGICVEAPYPNGWQSVFQKLDHE